MNVSHNFIKPDRQIVSGRGLSAESHVEPVLFPGFLDFYFSLETSPGQTEMEVYVKFGLSCSSRAADGRLTSGWCHVFVTELLLSLKATAQSLLLLLHTSTGR